MTPIFCRRHKNGPAEGSPVDQVAVGPYGKGVLDVQLAQMLPLTQHDLPRAGEVQNVVHMKLREGAQNRLESA